MTVSFEIEIRISLMTRDKKNAGNIKSHLRLLGRRHSILLVICMILSTTQTQ